MELRKLPSENDGDFSNLFLRAIREYWEEQVSDARLEGLAKGKAEGLAEGEAKAQLEIARKMKAKYPIEDVAEMTGLSADEVKKL